jgi:hypothetical protein
MSSYLDKKYINLVSSSLEKFKWKKANLANCRCPICGDSELNTSKARGYFFQNDNTFFYKCHNCGISYNVYKFLEIVSPSLYKEYCLEKFKDKKEEEPVEFVIKYDITSVEPEFELINQLPADHKAIKFLKLRKIPESKWDRFGYTKLFGTYAKNVNSDYSLFEDERLLIPIYDEHNQFIGVQGRAFGNQKPKYITLKKNEKNKLVYGLNTVNRSKPIFVVEGPIDSLFLPNAIACLGVGNFLEIREKFPTEILIFVVDNEPRNKTVVEVVKKLIENNEKICIFPSSIKEKDINDMVLNEVNVCDIIETNTLSGAAAMLAFNSWRKCQ